MKTTIQINSLEALERLIGGDSELEIDIRNNIVQKFAEKHLKPLANSTPFGDIKTLIVDACEEITKKALQDEVGELIQGPKWNSKPVLTLREDVKEKLRAEMKSALREEYSQLADEVRQELRDTYTPAYFAKVCAEVSEHIIQKRIKSEVEARLSAIKTAL